MIIGLISLAGSAFLFTISIYFGIAGIGSSIIWFFMAEVLRLLGEKNGPEKETEFSKSIPPDDTTQEKRNGIFENSKPLSEIDTTPQWEGTELFIMIVLLILGIFSIWLHQRIGV